MKVKEFVCPIGEFIDREINTFFDTLGSVNVLKVAYNTYVDSRNYHEKSVLVFYEEPKDETITETPITEEV